VLRRVLSGKNGARADVEIPAVNRRGRSITCSATIMAFASSSEADGTPGGAIVLMRDEQVDGASSDGQEG
jgi:hypothetical protein